MTLSYLFIKRSYFSMQNSSRQLINSLFRVIYALANYTFKIYT